MAESETERRLKAFKDYANPVVYTILVLYVVVGIALPWVQDWLPAPLKDQKFTIAATQIFLVALFWKVVLLDLRVRSEIEAADELHTKLWNAFRSSLGDFEKEVRDFVRLYAERLEPKRRKIDMLARFAEEEIKDGIGILERRDHTLIFPGFEKFPEPFYNNARRVRATNFSFADKSNFRGKDTFLQKDALNVNRRAIQKRTEIRRLFIVDDSFGKPLPTEIADVLDEQKKIGVDARYIFKEDAKDAILTKRGRDRVHAPRDLIIFDLRNGQKYAAETKRDKEYLISHQVEFEKIFITEKTETVDHYEEEFKWLWEISQTP